MYWSKSILSSKSHFLILFLVIYIILSILLFDPKLFTGGDNAVYVILAESITSGRGYRNLYLPDEPHHTQYPIGFPLLLSLPIILFGPNIIILKLIVGLTSIGAFYFMYKLGESFFKERTIIVMAFYISIPILITFNHWILSEMPFLCFSLGALYFVTNAKTGKEYLYIISFMLAVYAFFIRMAGITLIIAMILFLIIKKQYKYLAIFLLIFLACFVPWQIRNAGITHEGSYIDQLLARDPYLLESGKVGVWELMIRVWNNFVFYTFLGLPLTLLTSIRSPWVLGAVGLIFVVLTIIAFIERRKHISIVKYYFLFGLMLLLIWPYAWATERFLLPILPIFIIYIYVGIFHVVRKIKFKYLVHLITGIFVFLNLLSIFSQAKFTMKNNFEYLNGNVYAGYSLEWRNYFDVINWIKDNVPEDKVVMARKPQFVYLLSKHKSFTCPFSIDQNKIRNAFMRSDYIVLDNFKWTAASKRYLRPVIEKEIEIIQFVYITKKPRFYVVKIEK